jgi:hypothetical protein
MVSIVLFLGKFMKPDVFSGDASNFRERMIWIVRMFAGKPTRYKQLEDRFDISARKWQNMCNRVQQPSIEMVAALATVYPYFVHWMVTGSSDKTRQLNPADPNWFETMLGYLNFDEGQKVLSAYKNAIQIGDVTNQEAQERTEEVNNKYQQLVQSLESAEIAINNEALLLQKNVAELTANDLIALKKWAEQSELSEIIFYCVGQKIPVEKVTELGDEIFSIRNKKKTANDVALFLTTVAAQRMKKE